MSLVKFIKVILVAAAWGAVTFAWTAAVAWSGKRFDLLSAAHWRYLYDQFLAGNLRLHSLRDWLTLFGIICSFPLFWTGARALYSMEYLESFREILAFAVSPFLFVGRLFKRRKAQYVEQKPETGNRKPEDDHEYGRPPPLRQAIDTEFRPEMFSSRDLDMASLL